MITRKLIKLGDLKIRIVIFDFDLWKQDSAARKLGSVIINIKINKSSHYTLIRDKIFNNKNYTLFWHKM